MTSVTEQIDLRVGEEARFAARLTKPVRRQHLIQSLVSAARGIVMPIEPSEPLPPATDRAGSAFDRFVPSEIKILLAEDNPINQEVALTILKKKGFHADVVNNGLEAINALQEIAYDLVIMDVQMPEMDGLKATRIIRDPSSTVLNHHLPILAMTANAMKGDQEECLKAGMNDYLSKPFEPDELVDKIVHWTARVRGENNGKTGQNLSSATTLPSTKEKLDSDHKKPARSTEAETVPVAIQFELLCRRVMDDREMALELLRTAVTLLDNDLSGIEQAVQEQDRDQLKKQAHKLKGSAGNLSAEPLRRACEKIELAASSDDWSAISVHYKTLEKASKIFRETAEALLNATDLVR
jgi:CheY-like chemotaxis protein